MSLIIDYNPETKQCSVMLNSSKLHPCSSLVWDWVRAVTESTFSVCPWCMKTLAYRPKAYAGVASQAAKTYFNTVEVVPVSIISCSYCGVQFTAVVTPDSTKHFSVRKDFQI